MKNHENGELGKEPVGCLPRFTKSLSLAAVDEPVR